MENEKKKNTVRQPPLLLKVLVYAALIAASCVVCLVIMGPQITSPISSIWWLNGRTTFDAQQVEAILLERLPLGTSRAEVDEFIHDNLSGIGVSHCANENGICIKVAAYAILCPDFAWIMKFRFVQDVLMFMDVSTSHSGANCF